MAFGSVAETYDRVRPPYFQPLLDRAQEVLELGPEACVLDLGAGSGRLTRTLASRFATVFAVEPDGDMRRLLAVGTVLAGSAERIPLTDASVDAVFVGEAFHWFDAARAIAEVTRVLRPRGALAIVSTHWWETDPPLPESALCLLREPHERARKQRRPRWNPAFEASPFERLQYEKYEEQTTLDADRLLTLYSTTSALAALSHDEREALFTNARTYLAGPYVLPIHHELCWTRLL
jgi:SAM-dependent methyltransferase